MSQEIDWMGLWYKIIKERGENDRPTFGRLNLETNEIDWQDFSHSEMDGVGAMINYYEKGTFKLTKFPSLREKSLPNFLERITILFRLIFQSKKITTDWKEKNLNLEPVDPKAIHYKIFNVAETAKIDNYCKKNGFSSNAFFMNTATKVLLSDLSNNIEGTWTLPVNLRPLVQLKNPKANHSSAVLINVHPHDTPKETHTIISDSLKNRVHWGIWWIHQIGKIIGYQGMRYISNKNSKKSFLIGSFSNLSSWELPHHHIWVGSPPGSKNFPVIIMLMKANGHYSLSLKIHPFIMKDQGKTPELLSTLANQVLKIID